MPESPASRGRIAILYDDESKLSPSNPLAIAKFIKAANKAYFDADIIAHNDLLRLHEYDILFIRDTTAINNNVMNMAITAKSLGIVLMDDPDAILICCDKTIQHKIFQLNNIPAPKTCVIPKNGICPIPYYLGLPLILKNPYSCFSKGVFKVDCYSTYFRFSTMLLDKMDKIIVQEFMQTEYDWRIGILNNEIIFACKYYMSPGHWKVIKHDNKGEFVDGDSETWVINDVPLNIRELAIRTALCIGNGFYGVDIKEKDGQAYVIEVNDSPNVDAGIEDEILGDALYDKIIHHLISQYQAHLDKQASGLSSSQVA